MSEQKLIRQIKQRIKQNLNHQKLDQLELDSIPIRQFTPKIKKLIEQYSTIEYLTLNDCELISLQNFPDLPNLTILELSNNKIYDHHLYRLGKKTTQITHLMIDDNRLKSIETVASVLRLLPNLEQLQIANNLMGDSDFYREELFDRIPTLKIIDCKDKFGNIAIDSESESEDEENSMIAFGRKDGEQKIERRKSQERGNVGDQGEKELLKLLNQEYIDSQEEQYDQEHKRRNAKKSTQYVSPDAIVIPYYMQMENEQSEDKCRKVVKRSDSSGSSSTKQGSMQNFKTQVVDYDDEDDFGGVQ